MRDTCSQAHDSELNHTQPVSAHVSRVLCIPLAFVSIPQVAISPGVSSVSPSPIPFLGEGDLLPAALGDIHL